MQQLGSTHKDGSRFVGVDLGPVEPYARRGTPIVNKLVQSTVALSAVAKARVGDRFRVRFDGAKHWWLWSGEVRVGRLPWSMTTFEPKPWKDEPYPRVDDGVLEVKRLLLDSGGHVINVGGIVRPRT